MGGSAEVVLHWLPLGVGGHVLAFRGRVYERALARCQRRLPRAVFHAALEVRRDGEACVIEMAPVWGGRGDHGVVVVGPVGLRALGRLRLFRYEVRVWRGGAVPDLAHEISAPMVISRDPAKAAEVLALVRRVPPLIWGRDERHLGEMWTSNSMVAWVLARSGHDLSDVEPPDGGRAPGWRSGIKLAQRLEVDPEV